MVEVQDLIDTIIPRGSLVFIIHKNKPYKTGWWLKVANYNKEDECGYESLYVLAKGMTNYDMVKDSSRREHGKFAIKSSTLRNNHRYENQYEILAYVTGVELLILQEDNYSLNSRIFGAKTYLDSENIEVTDRFLKLLDYINEEERDKDLEELSNHIINN